MKRSEPQVSGRETWHDNPLYIGSIYVKPIKEKENYFNKCFQYMYYFCCCICCCD